MEEVISRRGPKPLDSGEKKMQFQIYPQKKMVEALGFYEARSIAEKAIEKEFKKISK